MDIIIGATKLAKELGVSRGTIYNYMNGGMPYSRPFNNKCVYDLKLVKEWLKSNK